MPSDPERLPGDSRRKCPRLRLVPERSFTPATLADEADIFVLLEDIDSGSTVLRQYKSQHTVLGAGGMFSNVSLRVRPSSVIWMGVTLAFGSVVTENRGT